MGSTGSIVARGGWRVEAGLAFLVIMNFGGGNFICLAACEGAAWLMECSGVPVSARKVNDFDYLKWQVSRLICQRGNSITNTRKD